MPRDVFAAKVPHAWACGICLDFIQRLRSRISYTAFVGGFGLPAILNLGKCLVENKSSWFLQVEISGVTLQDSPFWTVHVLSSQHVTVWNLRVTNDELIPNTDGVLSPCRPFLALIAMWSMAVAGP